MQKIFLMLDYSMSDRCATKRKLFSMQATSQADALAITETRLAVEDSEDVIHTFCPLGYLYLYANRDNG